MLGGARQPKVGREEATRYAPAGLAIVAQSPCRPRSKGPLLAFGEGVDP
jgi:hypothetical protein